MNQEEFIGALVHEAQDDVRLLSTKEQAAILSRGRSSLHSDEKLGLMTPAVRISERCVKRPQGEVKAIARARIAGLGDDGLRTLVRQLTAARARIRSGVAA